MYRFGDGELKDILVAWIALAVILSLKDFLGIGATFYGRFIITLPVVGVGFVGHELSHKFVAQSYGFWAQFRASYSMLMFAFILAYLLSFIFAAPGAVVIHPVNAYGRRVTLEENGRISLAGPLSNLAFASIFGIISIIMPFGLLNTIAQVGVFVNAILAIFNLLPFGILDGAKIFRWDKKIWVATLALAIMALIAS